MVALAIGTWEEVAVSGGTEEKNQHDERLGISPPFCHRNLSSSKHVLSLKNVKPASCIV